MDVVSSDDCVVQVNMWMHARLPIPDKLETQGAALPLCLNSGQHTGSTPVLPVCCPG